MNFISNTRSLGIGRSVSKDNKLQARYLNIAYGLDYRPANLSPYNNSM